MNNSSYMTHCPASPRSNNLNEVSKILVYLDPDMHYGDWIRVLMAIYNESGGNEEGFKIANDWSSEGMKYKGEREVRTKWRSFSKSSSKKITIGTLRYMVKNQPR
jgi:hypothetical protein